MRQIVDQYFSDHTEAKDGVMKAYYAYHAPHFRLTRDGHNFTSGSTGSKCSWCGRTRELVRWDDLPPECQNRPPDSDIAETVRTEEEKYFKLLEKAKVEVPKLIKRGVGLEQLYQTYGYDEETVKGFQ